MALITYNGGRPFLTEDRSITANTGSSPVSVTAYANTIDCRNNIYGGAYLQVQGANASSAGNVTFYFQHSPDGTNWVDCAAVVVALSGTTEITSTQAWASLDLRGIQYMRLASVANADPTYTALVNAQFVAKPADF